MHSARSRLSYVWRCSVLGRRGYRLACITTRCCRARCVLVHSSRRHRCGGWCIWVLNRRCRGTRAIGAGTWWWWCRRHLGRRCVRACNTSSRGRGMWKVRSTLRWLLRGVRTGSSSQGSSGRRGWWWWCVWIHRLLNNRRWGRRGCIWNLRRALGSHHRWLWCI